MILFICLLLYPAVLLSIPLSYPLPSSVLFSFQDFALKIINLFLETFQREYSNSYFRNKGKNTNNKRILIKFPNICQNSTAVGIIDVCTVCLL